VGLVRINAGDDAMTIGLKCPHQNKMARRPNDATLDTGTAEQWGCFENGGVVEGFSSPSVSFHLLKILKATQNSL